MNATGTNTDSSTSVIAMIGAVISPMALFGRLGRRELGMLLHHPLDVLDHDDGVVDHDADGEHEREERDRIGRIADALSTMKVPIRLTGTASVGISVARTLPRKRKTTITTRMNASISVFCTSCDGVGDEARRIVGDLPGQILGKRFCSSAMPLAHRLERGDRVGAGRLVDRDGRGRPAIESRFAIEIGGAELHAARRRSGAAPSRPDWCA